jgi:integrase
MATGIRPRGEHSWEAWVWSPREKKKIRRTFTGPGAFAAAKNWRSDATSAVRKGTLKAATRQTLQQAGEGLVAGMKDGSIRKRDGERFKPSVIRGYAAALENRIYPDLGACRLTEIRRADLQDLVERLQAELLREADDEQEERRLAASTIRNVLMPVRTIYRRALKRGDVMVNPTLGLELPALTGKRDRVASPAEAERLLAALPEADRPLWATALYGGLRMGELRALDWSNVDLAGGIIRVLQSWDRIEGLVEPKSKKSKRTVPIPSVLRGYLVEHRKRRFALGQRTGFVFGETPERPFNYDVTVDRALRTWKAAKLEPIGLHECRHTYVTLMFEAGLSLEEIGDYVGHNSAYMTDRYRHLREGHEARAAERFDAFLAATGAETGASRPKSSTGSSSAV